MARNFQKTRTKAEKKEIRRKERNSQSMGRHQAFLERHMMRRSELGRQTEVRVEKLLVKKITAGELASFKYFPANSPEDCQGKDFQVSKEIEEEVITASFGITISLNCYQEHQAKHPDEPCILIPPEMGDERIWYRICQILKEVKNARA